jgi:gluconolactonase
MGRLIFYVIINNFISKSLYMKNQSLLTVLAFVICCRCGNNKTETKPTVVAIKDSGAGKIEIYSKSISNSIDSTATIEIIGRGFTWAEGPVWLADKQMLLFTDVPENKIYQWKKGDSTWLYLTPSGYTGKTKRIGGEDGANGLALDHNGSLLLCQSGNRCIARLNTSVDSPGADFTVLSAGYKGQKFNSPNDLVIDSKGNIYFTDPIYGLPQREKDSTREMNFEGVYRIGTDGKTTLLIDTIARPNGIALSLDEKTLYIGSSDDVHPCWYSYKLDGKGNIKSGGILLDGAMMKAKATVKQGADGFKVYKDGNIFSSGPDGINIISPAGKLLALIKIYNRATSNCAFDDTKNVLFITADDLLLKVVLHH